MKRALILAQEPANLALFLDERADDARPAEGLAEKRGQIRDAFLGALRHVLDFMTKEPCGREQERDDDERKDRQPPLEDK